MFKFLGRMFGTERAMNAAVDGLVSGIDKLWYTKEEQAEDHRAYVTQAREMFLSWMDKTQGQNLARRVLAFAIAGTWLSQYFVMMLFSVSAVWTESPELRVQLLKSSEVIGAFADGMTGAMMLILTFYFAAPHLDKIIGPAITRFGQFGKPVSEN